MCAHTKSFNPYPLQQNKERADGTKWIKLLYTRVNGVRGMPSPGFYVPVLKTQSFKKWFPAPSVMHTSFKNKSNISSMLFTSTFPISNNSEDKHWWRCNGALRREISRRNRNRIFTQPLRNRQQLWKKCLQITLYATVYTSTGPWLGKWYISKL